MLFPNVLDVMLFTGTSFESGDQCRYEDEPTRTNSSLKSIKIYSVPKVENCGVTQWAAVSTTLGATSEPVHRK